MKKSKKGKTFDPGKYGMICFPDCGGVGKSFYNVEGPNVCRVCGGVGLIKKEANSFHGNKTYYPVVLVNF